MKYIFRTIVISFLFILTLFVLIYLFVLSNHYIHYTKSFIKDYKFENLEKVSLDDFNATKIIALEYNRRVKHIYVLTDTSQFFILDIKTLKVIRKITFEPFFNNPIDMKCNSVYEDSCMILNALNKQTELLQIDDISAYKSMRKPIVERFAILDEPVEKILKVSESHFSQNDIVCNLVLMDDSKHLHVLNLRLTMPSDLFYKTAKYSDNGVYFDLIGKVKGVSLEKYSEFIKHVDDSRHKYHAKAINIEYDPLWIVYVNKKTITYEDMSKYRYTQMTADNKKNSYEYETIDSSLDAEDIALMVDNRYAMQAMILSADDHQLYKADIIKTTSKQVVETLHAIVQVIMYYLFS